MHSDSKKRRSFFALLFTAGDVSVRFSTVQKTKRAFLVSVFAGLVLAPVLMAAVMFLIPDIGTRVVLFPGEILASVVGPILGSVVTSLAPEGGPGAAVALFLLGSFLFWWLVLSAGSFCIFCWQRRI